MNWLYSTTHTEPTNEELGIVPWMSSLWALVFWTVIGACLWALIFLALT